MIKRVVFFILYFILLVSIYIISSLLFKRGLSDLPEISLYYILLAILLLFIDLIKIRKIKWLVIFLINLVAIIMVILGAYAPDASSIYLLVVMGPLNIPFLPRLEFTIDDKIVRVTVVYLLYFILPLIYWYALYKLSKSIVNKYLKP